MQRWLLDLRAAARRLLRRRAYSLAVLATLTLGIGAMTTVLALVQGVLLRPLDVPGGERVMSVVRQGASTASLGLPNVVELRHSLQGIEAISAVFDDFAMDRTDGDHPTRLKAQLIESPYFQVVASQPLLGRLLQASDDQSGAEPVVVLAESWWRSAFAADPAVLGRTLRLSGVTATIVGVAPAAADVRERNPHLWATIPPFAPWAPTSPGSNNFEVLARLRDDVPMADARAELVRVSAELAARNGTPHKQLDALPLIELLAEPARRGLWALLVAVGLLLLLAVANVSALLLVQVSQRRGELAMRSALGASRPQLLRLLLCEGALLGLSGGLLGWLLATGLFAALQAQSAWSLPRLATAQIEPALLLAVMALSLFSALLFSAWPAWRATPRASGLPSRSTHGRSDRRTLAGVMVFEIALACALLGGAMLLGRSFLSLSSVPLGFDPQDLISADIVLPEARYHHQGEQNRAFLQMVEHLSAQPGIAAAAMVVGPPLSSTQRIGHDLLVDGLAQTQGNARYRPFVGDYFSALGLPVLAGRGYAQGDAQGERVAWVNQRFVDRYLPGIEPLGQRIAWPAGQAGPSTQPQWMRIVGVVGDVRSADLRADEVPAVYAPYLQREASWIRFGTLLARTRGAPEAQAAALRAALASADGSVAIGEIVSLRERAAAVLTQDRVLLQLVGVLAGLALLLGVQGVFGVVSFAVQQRRRELGVRQALGATPLHTAGTVLGSTLTQVGLGAGLGLASLLAAGEAVSKLLYGIEPADPLALGTAVLALGCAALLAAAWPTWRARRLDLSQVLRAD